MSESKHTPGEWRVVYRNVTDLYMAVVGVCMGDKIIELGDMNYGNNKADAVLLAAAPEMLDALEACCIATQGKQKAFCECFQHDSRPCLDMEGVCWFGKNGNCHIWKALQKAMGQG